MAEPIPHGNTLVSVLTALAGDVGGVVRVQRELESIEAHAEPQETHRPIELVSRAPLPLVKGER